jgi:hypothetical protein
MAGGLFNRFTHIIFTVEVEDVGNKVESILIVLDLGVEAGKIETVCQVLFVNFAEVFVSA